MKWDFVLWYHFLFPAITLYPFDKQQITMNQVVVATTKIDIFKQITTITTHFATSYMLLLLPQR